MAYILGTTANETLTGSTSDDEIYGLDGNDVLYGLDGNDILSGGVGNDRLDGGIGGDVMAGGVGDDTYYVDDPNDIVIEEFAGYSDTDIVYVSLSHYDIGTATIEQIQYSGNGAAMIFGSDSNNYIGTGGGADWLDGRGGNDFLFGGAGDDILFGGAGNDELDGWQGSDTMSGGAGDDVYNVDSAGDVVTEAAGEGVDTVKVRKSSYTLPANVENADLRYYSGSISVTGNSSGNIFIMGTGAQSVSGSTGNDTVSYAYATVGVSVDLWNQVYGGEAADDSLASIENLTGSAFDDVLRALGTASVIDGGPGADVMEGRNGGDIYYVDNAGDLVIEGAGGGTDEVRVLNLASYTLPGFVEKLTNATNHAFTGAGNSQANEINGGTDADQLSGNGGNDILNGGAGDDLLAGGYDNDTLNGGPGADVLYGGEGSDVFHVDDAGDSVIEFAGEGTDQVYTTLAVYALTGHVEHLSFNGVAPGSLDFTGNNLDNILIGQGHGDSLNGLAGADELRGGAGGDRLDGGAGDDILLGDSGADILTGGLDGDVFRFFLGDTGLGAGADRIDDFEWAYDTVDLRGIDADPGTAGDQAFTFIGTAAFSSVAGQVRYVFDGTDTWIQGDIDGDAVADFEIVLTGSHALVSGDFYL